MNIQLMLSLFGGLLSFLHIKHTELRPKKLDDAEQKKSTFFSFSSRSINESLKIGQVFLLS